MAAIIINGKQLAEKIKDELVVNIQKLPSRPSLAILLVGDRKDSQLYVQLKEKEGKKCGIDTHLYKFNEQTTEDDILATLDFLNHDNDIDGILLQLPLPQHLNTDKIVNAINPNKDVDGFHKINLENIKHAASPHDYIMPPLAGVILHIISEYNIDLHKKNVAIIAHSDIFMQGIGTILQQHGGNIHTYNYTPNKQKELQQNVRQADIIITAVGKKHYLTSAYVKPGATIIDIGIINENNKTYGDVDIENVKKIAGFITPVPGGVGPMTIAMAFSNVLQLYKKRIKKQQPNNE